jgi:anaerobic selenocysteine-containing dehydrogenase
MTRKLSRRAFIKTAGIGAAASAVLTGCGPASRYVLREPYTRMPEYTYNGQSTFYATTCRECPAGCGTVVRTEQGRALKVEGNPNHPVNLGKTCARGQVALQGLYNPDRIKNPLKSNQRGSGDFSDLNWDDGIKLVQEALESISPTQVAFLMGMAPDHLYDLVYELTQGLGAPPPLRYGAHEIFDARRTLINATQRLFASSNLPFFDLSNADVTFSFGANFLETYLSPLAYSRGFAQMRRGKAGRRGFLVQFEPRLSQTAATADEWVAVAPGSEGSVALAIGLLAAQIRGGAIPNAFLGVNIDEVATLSGIPAAELQRLAEIFATASHPLAIPGGGLAGCSNGLEATQAVMALNTLVGNLGVPGGMYLIPPSPVHSQTPISPASIVEVNRLIDRMRRGEVQVLFIHGINPAFELPAGLGFTDALSSVPLVVSFSTFPDETSMEADYILPDHSALESWGYQKAPVADRRVISGLQPVVAPFYDTRATADVLLAAVQAIGGNLAAALPYQDEFEYIQNSLIDLVTQDGIYNAPEIRSFMAQFQQFGGWWAAEPELEIPDGAHALSQPLSAPLASFDGSGEYHLLPYMSPVFGDGSGANKPWLQEIPDPTTTVMWNTWVEINPETAVELHLEHGDVVRLTSPMGELEAPVYLYPGIPPELLAVPFGQGHTAFGRYAQGRGANPVHQLSLVFNGADDLAFGSTMVAIEKTGRNQPLSRLESSLESSEE